MSNLISNGNFSSPSITTNSFLGIDYFTTQQKNDFIWVDDDHFTLQLCNGVTAYEYEYPGIINTSQYLSFQFYGAISQQINLIYTGDYILKLAYVNRPNYPINPLYIYLNYDLIYTITKYTTTWTNIFVLKNITKTGIYNLRIVSNDTSADKDIAITNIEFYKSNNIITNSYFYQPSIFENTYYNVNNFYSPDMYNLLYWSYDIGSNITYGNVFFINGLVDYDNSGFTSSDLRFQQYIVLRVTGTIFQNINCPVSGNYKIQLYIGQSSNSVLNRFNMYIDNNLIDSLPDLTLSGWTYYYITTYIQAGQHEFKISGTIGKIALTFIEIIPPSSYIEPLPAPSPGLLVNSNIFKNTLIKGAFTVNALTDLSNNIIYDGITKLIPRGDTCACFIGDNNFFDSSTGYGTLSISRLPGNKSRPHAGFIRGGQTVFQQGYLEKFTGYENNFGLFHGFAWTLGNYPAITFSINNLVGINNINPSCNLDVIGNSLFRNNLTLSGNLYTTGTSLLRNSLTLLSGGIDISGTSLFRNDVNFNTNLLISGNNKLARIWYDSTRSHTIIGNRLTTYDILSSGGGLIQHQPAAIFNKTNVSDYLGTGYYFNTNSNYRTDFINYGGASTVSASNQGFDFWVSNLSFIPKNIASISVSGNLTLSGTINAASNITTANGNITATNGNITATNGNLFTSSYVNISNLVNYGLLQSVSAAGTTSLSFPIPEIVMCDCTAGVITLRLPDLSTLSTTATCKFYIRRVSTGANNISLSSAGTGNQFMGATNGASASITGITNVNIMVILFNKLWYYSSYA